MGSEDIKSPRMLQEIAQCATTIQKIDSCLRARQELGGIKPLFTKTESIVQLEGCEIELQEALTALTTAQGVGIPSPITEFNSKTERRHQELLELIKSPTGSLDTVSMIARSSLNTTFGTCSLLPGPPKIFHGRDSELEIVVNSLLTASARVVILGPGGMGKTTLAIAALNHAKVADKYPTHHFISCDSVYTKDSLVATIASNLKLEGSHRSERYVIHHLSTGPPCLFILDNFETTWDPIDGRTKVEELFSRLTNPNMALLITMRGAKRPKKIRWTEPFLPPLSPLPSAAAREMFIEVTDRIRDNWELERLLKITDHIPLAIQLVATVTASDGCTAILERWNRERTAILSAGDDKPTNLEISIALSLSSVHMISSPHTVDLLSLMSLLPDGISDLDLVQSNPPIPDILQCKMALIRTSLAHVDHAGRLKVLAPIRDYIRAAQPPSMLLVQPLQQHFRTLLEVRRCFWLPNSPFARDSTPRLVSNLGNMHNILRYAFDSGLTGLGETMQDILAFSRLNLVMNHGFSPLMLHLAEMLTPINNHELNSRFITEVLQACEYYKLPDPEASIDEAIQYFKANKDPRGEGKYYYTLFYHVVATYYLDHLNSPKKAQNFYSCSVFLGSQWNSDQLQVASFIGLARIGYIQGNNSQGLKLAREAHRIAVVAGDVWGEITSLRCQALCYYGLGDFKCCLALVHNAKELLRRADMQVAQINILFMNLEAELYHVKTEYPAARHIHRLILDQTSAVLAPIQYAYALLNIASLDIVTGAHKEVVSQSLDPALATFQNLGVFRGASAAEVCRADLRLREGQVVIACTDYKRVFADVYRTNEQMARQCLVRLADPTYPVHDTIEVTRWAVVFLAFTLHHPLVKNMLSVYQALQCLGHLLAQQSLNDEALSLLTVALEGFTWMDIHKSRAECMRTIGDLYSQNRERAKASTFWKDARPLFKRSLQAKAVQEIDDRLAKMEKHDHADLDLTAPPAPMPHLLNPL
ncbi:hypothetical protein K438DRAFT_1944425 [Mycena galopus ATCC 62051]|nr:hypothetical protein K438DRAFT_1944425 [Mycena galopus ATCC 62051]